MSSKTKTNPADLANTVVQHAGVGLMIGAATLSMFELPDHGLNGKAIVPNAPVLKVAVEDEFNNNPLRREKEETEQHYISYSVNQRTPARSGKK